MKLSRILCLLLALALTACVAIGAVSCGAPSTPETPDNPDTPSTPDTPAEEVNLVDHKVKFVDEEGLPASGIVVALKYGDFETEAVTTNSLGEAVIGVDEKNEDYVFAIIKSSEGYVYKTTKNYNRFAYGEKTHTINVEKAMTVTVKVVDTDGNAVANVGVQICPGETCLDALPTDANGEVSRTFAIESHIGVKLVNADGYFPDGYVFPDAIDENGYIAYFEDGETTLTITLEKE